MPAKATPRKRAKKNESRALEGAWLNSLLGGGATSSSGVRVNAKTALTCSPVRQAVDVITSDLSRMPFHVYKPTSDGRGKERATDHPAYKILRRSIGEMTSNLWIARMVGHALLYGNAYSRVIWRGSRVVGMEWLHRDWVQRYRDAASDYFIVKYPMERGGNTRRVDRYDMFHLVGMTLDDWGGLSLIDYARDTFGRQMSAEQYGADFFQNDATPSGFFMHPGEMSEEAQRRFLASFQGRHAGAGNRWKVGILEEDMKWQTAGVSPQDAMLIDQLKMGVSDVARFFNLPPHKLGDASRAAYNTLEAEEKAYLSGSLGKWISRLEYEATDKLFLDSEIDGGHFAEFVQDSHSKADTQARYQAYSLALQWGILNPNEVRARENLNPYEGGDEYLKPLTHGTAQQSTHEPTPPDATPADHTPDMPQEPPQATRTAFVMRDLLAAKLDDGARLLVNSATRAAAKPKGFLAAINALDKHRVAIESMTSSARSAATTFTGSDVGDLAGRLIGEASTRFLEASECQPEELQQRVTDAGTAFRAWVADLATDLVIGDQ